MDENQIGFYSAFLREKKYFLNFRSLLYIYICVYIYIYEHPALGKEIVAC